MLLNLFNKYKSMISYLFWGGITTLVNIVVFIVLIRYANTPVQVSNVIAWVASVSVAYVSNKLWVFNSKTETPRELLSEAFRFFSVRAITLVFDIIIVWIGISLLHWNDIIVKVIDNVFIIISNYFFSKWLVFHSSNNFIKNK